MQEHNPHAETNPWLFHQFEEKYGGFFHDQMYELLVMKKSWACATQRIIVCISKIGSWRKVGCKLVHTVLLRDKTNCLHLTKICLNAFAYNSTRKEEMF